WSFVYLIGRKRVRADLAAGAAAAVEGAGTPAGAPRAGCAASADRAAETDAGGSGAVCGAEPCAPAAGVGVLANQARDRPALAPPTGRAPLDVSRTEAGRPAAARVVAAVADPSSR